MEILLIDNNECTIGGHNYIYRKTLHEIQGTEIVYQVKNFTNLSKNPIKAYKEREDYFDNLPRKEIMHFLHLDVFYTFPSLFKKMKKNNVKIIGTLHWYPNKKIKSYLLKNSAKYIDTIVVHSEYIKRQLNLNGIYNVEVVDYPAFHTEDIKESLVNNDKYVNILCIGATRYDKGIDIAAKSFRYIDNNAKKYLKFVFAGKELDNAYQLPRELAKEYNINLEIISKSLTDEEYWNCMKNSDVILLPYRKIFTGNSGPMTDGIILDKYILGPNNGNLGYLINKYDLGETFVQEDEKSLGEVISKLCDKDLVKQHSYKSELTIEKFKDKYKMIYKHFCI
ncbi:MAG: glycosyltransferase [Romboutsia timonensis]|uniref:glycosyltransferase n=1 Tax=Romboutsia timonensis TaxID=1776391 RepID=UPI002A74851A|nr:glycosyltransferase [Romboutsia timonensis]MDY2884036.1 glycosyltransferase [Romboutsia timonensis]